MRRSKVQRQEARRERRAGSRLLRREKAEEKIEEKWMVALAQDCRVPKYPFLSAPVGFDEHVAHRLAELVDGAPRYAVLPLDVFRWARAQGEPITAQEALQRYVPEEPGELAA